jgi:hypothetical protein
MMPHGKCSRRSRGVLVPGEGQFATNGPSRTSKQIFNNLELQLPLLGLIADHIVLEIGEAVNQTQLATDVHAHVLLLFK